MKHLRLIGKWLLGLILLVLILAMMISLRFGRIDLPKPELERITFLGI
jgi:hypothetical protein